MELNHATTRLSDGPLHRLSRGGQKAEAVRVELTRRVPALGCFLDSCSQPFHLLALPWRSERDLNPRTPERHPISSRAPVSLSGPPPHGDPRRTRTGITGVAVRHLTKFGQGAKRLPRSPCAVTVYSSGRARGAPISLQISTFATAEGGSTDRRRGGT
jgi:hypothetical protein